MERQMAETSTIFKIANKNKVSLDNAEFGLECYQEGMIELLRDVGGRELETVVVKESKRTKEASIKQEKYFKELLNILNPQEAEMLREYEELFSNQMYLEEDDHFIEGFIRGYRYLKSQIVHEM